MKQNITLSLDKDLIKKAKVISAKRDTSVSKLLAQELREMIESAESYEAAKRRAIANLRTGCHLGGKITVSREELHER
ncbi:MAG: hypothetical protein JRE23_11570 [Deltaproteobacteria bacterium]|nr:hypothetical protein [Deltaproteobacteria bacterium]